MLKKSPKPITVAALAALLFLLVGLAGLPRYGLTWDDAENLLVGAHYARFFASGDKSWLDFDAHNQAYAAMSPKPAFYNPYFNAPERYPPVANVAAVVTHTIFSDWLGWLGDVEGYHLSVLLFASLALFVLVAWMGQAYGLLAGGIAGLTLALTPVFQEHAHLNFKDVPFAALVLLALWLFWWAMKTQTCWPILVSAVATGLALGTRILTLEVWPILAAGYALPVGNWAYKAWRERKWAVPWQLLTRIALHVLLALLVFYLVWPWLWPAPIVRLQAHLNYGKDVGRGMRVLYAGQIWQSGETLPWHYSLVSFVLTMPLPILALGLFGAGVAMVRVFRQRDATAGMLLALFGIALVRHSVPSQPQYDGTRHLLDGIVAFAGMSGLGVMTLCRTLKARGGNAHPIRAKMVLWSGLLVAYLPVAATLVRLAPHQSIFHNPIVGSTQGAAGYYTQEYWGHAYRGGCAWMNAHLPSGAKVLARVGGHLAQYCIRPDLVLIPDEALPGMSPDEVIFVTYITRLDKYDWISQAADRHFTPVYTLSRGSAPLFKVVEVTVGELLAARE